MINSFHLEVLPPPQFALWPALRETPDMFTLYGGTAIALQLGHRESIDFDFFTFENIQPERLLETVPYLCNASILQEEQNTLTCLVGQSVKVSFFGLPRLRRLQPPLIVPDNGLKIATLLDLAGTKARTVQQRAELKDYLDIDAIISSGIDLHMMLAAALSIYGASFNSSLTFKALTFFEEGNVTELSEAARKRLTNAVLKAIEKGVT